MPQKCHEYSWVARASVSMPFPCELTESNASVLPGHIVQGVVNELRMMLKTQLMINPRPQNLFRTLKNKDLKEI